MKSFQPKDSPALPDDDDPGGPPPADETSANTDQPQQTETQPMPDTARRLRNAEVNFRGTKRSNATEASVTDPDARLYKKAPGAAAILCFTGEDGKDDSPGDCRPRREADGGPQRAGLADGTDPRRRAWRAEGGAREYQPAPTGLDPRPDARGGPRSIPAMSCPDEVARRSRSPFGWAKTVGGKAQTIHRGLDRVRAQFTMTMAACNLARLPELWAT